jgi:hypothetical protein
MISLELQMRESPKATQASNPPPLPQKDQTEVRICYLSAQPERIRKYEPPPTDVLRGIRKQHGIILFSISYKSRVARLRHSLSILRHFCAPSSSLRIRIIDSLRHRSGPAGADASARSADMMTRRESLISRAHNGAGRPAGFRALPKNSIAATK